MSKNELLCIESQKHKLPIADDLLYIFVTQFNDEAVSKFYDQFLKMSANSDTKIIPVVISSFGGQVHSLLPMLDIIKASNKPVATIALGKAMSCGAILLAAGTKGYRYAAPNADVMLHEVTSMSWDKSTNLQNDAKHVKRINDLLFQLVGDWSGKGRNYFLKQLKKKSNVDWYLTANESKRLGLVDHVGVPSLLKK
jgi:ATP-dependent Clp protease protease subunit